MYFLLHLCIRIMIMLPLPTISSQAQFNIKSDRHNFSNKDVILSILFFCYSNGFLLPTSKLLLWMSICQILMQLCVSYFLFALPTLQSLLHVYSLTEECCLKACGHSQKYFIVSCGCLQIICQLTLLVSKPFGALLHHYKNYIVQICFCFVVFVCFSLLF